MIEGEYETCPPDVGEPLTGRFPEASSRPGLDPFFLPQCVAIIGATENPGTVGRMVLRNLVESKFRSKTFSGGRKLPPVAEDFTSFLQSYIASWAGRSGIL